jgi:YD repeat-containing protein
MDNCRGCGSLLDLTDRQVSEAVDELIESTRTDPAALGRVCPLCGHRTSEPVSHRKSVLFALLAALLLITSGLAVAFFWQRETDRQQAARQALEQLRANGDVARLLGYPITLQGVTGLVKADETGWQEVRLSLAIRGPRSRGLAEVVGGRASGRWTFSTLDVFLPQEEKRVDVVAGRVVALDRDAFAEAHTQAARAAEIVETAVPGAIRTGDHPCLWATPGRDGALRIGDCRLPAPIAVLKAGAVDRFEVDLRSGKFVLRQTDLVLVDGALEVPLTRTYTSDFWRGGVNAFGHNSTHDFDIAPVGSRNPYTYLMLVLPDGDFLYCPRISKGTGYADAVYRHSETSSSFYKALIRWDGRGWAASLDDGSRMHFPESYNGKTMAQGAPTEMVDAAGNVLRLVRDGSRNLREIRTPGGKAITLGYDGQPRVVRARDDGGHWVEYTYDQNGMLAATRRSDGRGRRYGYEGALLTSVRDEPGGLLLRNWYQGEMVVRQEDAKGLRYEIRYHMARDGQYAEAATVVLPDGTERTVRTADAVSPVLKNRR